VRPSAAFGLKAGKFFGPVSVEKPNPRHFMEAAYNNQIAPNRDIGLEASGAFGGKLLAYRLGMYHGAPNSVWNRVSNPNSGDDGDFSFGGRLAVAPFSGGKNEAVKGLVISAGGLYGHEAYTTGNINSNGQQAVVRGYAIDGSHLRAAAAVEWYCGSGSAIAEYTIDRQERAGALSTVTNSAWRVSGGYVLTGEKSMPGGVTPKTPFNWQAGTWGAFEVAARISGLKVDDDVVALNPATNLREAVTFGIGLNWFLNSNVQVRFNAEKSNFTGGATGALADDEFYFFSRLQFRF
jgi:phosphate-selective porin OprO/OprP